MLATCGIDSEIKLWEENGNTPTHRDRIMRTTNMARIAEANESQYEDARRRPQIVEMCAQQ